MQTIKKQRIGENLVFFMVWALIILVPILAQKMLGAEHVNLETVFISWRKITPYLLLFVINNWLMAPYLLFKRRYVSYILCNLLVISVIFGVVDIYERNLLKDVPDVETMIQVRKASFTDLALPWNILLGLFMVSANSLIKLLYKTMHDEQEMESLKHENLRAEIDYLKYQINPHFFMNTLNNIHALIDIDPTEAQDAVIELSRMMRHVLYESGGQSITLEQDLQFIEHYVRLMQIRYAEQPDIRIEYSKEEVAQVSIPPLLLIVFVENAFKHGVVSNRHSFIHIGVELTPKTVTFTVVNSRRADEPEHEPGIGLKNVKKRLDLIYGPAYTLELRDEPEAYIAQLILPRNHD